MNYLFLQAAGIDPAIINGLFLVAMVAIFYFFMIRPQTQKQKAQTAFMEGLKKGDDVVTGSGMLGRVNKIENEIITLEVGSKTYVQVTKNAVSKEMTEAVFSKEVAKAK